MKANRFFLSRLLPSVVGAATLAAVGMSGAQAASVICGDASLGLRTVTVDPALVGGLCDAGLTNLGNGALEALVDSLIAPDDAFLLDRDTANNNGGLLEINGVNLLTGTWDLDSSVWGDNDRVFLYFHFGDANDDPSATSATDPDIFIVELDSADTSGSWTFSGKNGLSNIALLGTGTDGGVPPSSIPEPGVLFLMGAGLLGLGMARRRKSA